MVTFLGIIAAIFRATIIGKQSLILENLALRQQLGFYSCQVSNLASQFVVNDFV